MIKNIINFSIKNKLAIVLMTIIVAIAGAYSALKMNMEMLPNISSPVLTVTTPYPGATPENVLESVTDPIENRVASMEGVEDVQSQSMQNASAITITYDFGTDMDKAEEEIKDAIESLDLPEEASDTTINQISMYEFPIISYSFTDKDNDLEQLTKDIEENLLPRIEGVDGVSSASFNGQMITEVDLKFDEKALEENGLTEQDVLQYIKAAASDFPLGLYTFEDDLKSIVVDGQFTSIEALEDLEIPAGQKEGADAPELSDAEKAQMSPEQLKKMQKEMEEKMKEADIPTVKLGDIASIENTQERESISKTNGKDSLSIQIVKTTTSNTVSVVDDVKEVIDDYVKENNNTEAVLMMDQAKPIVDSIKTMVEKALIGALFAIIMILLFLRNIRSTLIAVVSIPMSILIAFLVLKQFDITINIMTLGAMTVAIGRVIDDSIVVIENIYRRMKLDDEPLKGRALIADATKEMFIPIMSSTVVTIAVFFPLAMVTGEVGEIFRPFAYTVVFALVASLIIAITIVPMLAHVFFRKGVKDSKSKEGKQGIIQRVYHSVLEWSLSHKWIVSIAAIAIFVGSLMLTPLVGTSFISTGEDKFLALTYKPSPGETENEVVKKAEKVEDILNDNKDVLNIQYSVGGENPMSPGSTTDTAMFVEYDKDTENWDTEAERVLDKIAELNHEGTWKNLDFATGGSSNSVSITVTGPSIEAMRDTVKEVEDVLNNQDTLTNVSSSISDSYEEYQLVVDHKKASKLGLSAGQVAQELNQYDPKETVATVALDGVETDVILVHDKKESWTEKELKNTIFTTPLGKEVKLSEFVTIEKGTSSDTITRKNGDISTTVDAKINAKDIGTTTEEVQAEIDKIETPDNVSIKVGGTTEDIEDSFNQLGIAMLAAIAIVYLILVLTFHGGIAPFSILFSLPFTITGVILALLISGETLSVPSMIGLLMLIGIVVTNAIVLIDRVIRMEESGLPTREALLEAATTRVRPILMTALATIGALVPLVFGGDSSVLISKALGVTVIGGLLSSTLLTLIVVPVVYEMLMNLKHKFVKSEE